MDEFSSVFGPIQVGIIRREGSRTVIPVNPELCAVIDIRDTASRRAKMLQLSKETDALVTILATVLEFPTDHIRQ